MTEQRFSPQDLAASTTMLHDAEVTAIAVDRVAGRARLDLLSDQHADWRIEFHGVTCIRAVDLISQNIVSRLLISSIFNFSTGQLASWIRWANSLKDTPSRMTDQQIEAYKSKIISNELILCVLEPSWGAEFAVICKTITCFKGTIG